MWIGKKTAQIGPEDRGPAVGVVSLGGARPGVVTDGEVRNARLLTAGGGMYVPRAGDQVLMERSGDGESVVLGLLAEAPEGVEPGEIFISTGGGGWIHIKNDGGVALSGRISLTGTTEVLGTLLINGAPYIPSV